VWNIHKRRAMPCGDAADKRYHASERHSMDSPDCLVQGRATPVEEHTSVEHEPSQRGCAPHAQAAGRVRRRVPCSRGARHTEVASDQHGEWRSAISVSQRHLAAGQVSHGLVQPHSRKTRRGGKGAIVPGSKCFLFALLSMCAIPSLVGVQWDKALPFEGLSSGGWALTVTGSFATGATYQCSFAPAETGGQPIASNAFATSAGDTQVVCTTPEWTRAAQRTTLSVVDAATSAPIAGPGGTAAIITYVIPKSTCCYFVQSTSAHFLTCCCLF
jgi:hypothetical protein